MPAVPDELRQRLRKHGQEHALAWWDELSEEQARSLLDQLNALDLDHLAQLYARRDHSFAVPASSEIQPVPVIRLDANAGPARQAGEEALRRGEVAVLVVAGGQGTRLGF